MPQSHIQRLFKLVVLLVGLLLGVDLISHLITEIFWFQKVGYLPAFFRRLATQGVLWAIASGLSAAFLFLNLTLAHRLQHPVSPGTQEWQDLTISPYLSRSPSLDLKSPRSRLKLFWLLPVVLALSVLVGLLVLHYGQVAFTSWHQNLASPSVLPTLPPRFRSGSIWQILNLASPQIWQLGWLIVVAIALISKPRFWLHAIAIVMSMSFGLAVSGRWANVLQYFHATPFNETEPLFNQDIGFYIFTLPVWELLEFWLVGLFLYGLIAVILTYLLSGNSLSQGTFPGFSSAQLHHLHGLSGVFMLSLALRYWLRRYDLLYSPRGIVYGASYSDVTIQLPAYTILSFSSLAIALFLLWRTLFWVKTKPKYSRQLVYGLGLYIAFSVIGGWLVPALVQRFIVEPNELAREQTYIQRNIALTRQAFALDEIDVETFDPQNQLTYQDVQDNQLTIRNIRIWDTRPLLQTNRQLQQIRLYYSFPNADIDRYTFIQTIGGEETEKRQVIVAARELDYNAVPQQAQTWINEHLIYTHGYGFTMSPVNTVGPGGLPDYFVRNISGPNANNNDGALETSNPLIRASIPIGHPRIYYGELTNTYIMAPTKVRELDYPSGDENVYNTYNGQGGIAISSWWRRLLFAEYLKDWQMIFTRNFTPETKILLRRNINQRIRAIAPFLRYDNDPYLVVANADFNDPNQKDSVTASNYLYWIIDAYTTSDRYPYSDPGNDNFNYIRNSVKVVVDAYDGSVFFYVADLKDPLIKTWKAIFPKMFRMLSEMPITLRSHIRYPGDFYSVQSERLLTYHMTDPQVFYNREDQWQIPQEIYGSEQQQVAPYYLIMRLPTAESEEFILLLPFTPTQRNNMIAWLAARSDGENYGKLLLYQFPKQQLIFGPEQIEARINQDPVISQQISLWNRQGSRAIQGNLLVIPIERSLLYVEPLYLEAEQNSLPTLVRVIVAYENRIVMAETLEQAFQAIFQTPKTTAPAIIRRVEEPAAVPDGSPVN